MKRRWMWFGLLFIAAVVAYSFYLTGRKPPPPAAVTAPGTVDAAKTTGETIDFSSGKPVVKDTPEDRAAMDAAMKEMQAAQQGVTFGPTDKPTAPPKPAPPPNAAPPPKK